jgi:hypothetical protein
MLPVTSSTTPWFQRDGYVQQLKHRVTGIQIELSVMNKKHKSQVWWFVSIILATRRQRSGGLRFEASLGK